MTSSWKIYRLGDCATFLSGGTPSKRKAEYWGGDIPWISCKDMKVSRIYDAEDHITQEGAQNGTRLVCPGTILIVVRGMILAKEFPVVIAMRQVAFNQDLKALQCKQNVDSGFLYYWLLGSTYQICGIADEAAHGTKRLQSDRLLNLSVNLPPIALQRKIAAILSAYDDLIENNIRRIAILEEMARMLYREWFVHFRFPGHEKVKLVDSPLGKIPEGWEVKRFSDIAFFVNGFAFKPTHWGTRGIPIIKIKELKEGVTENTPRNSGQGLDDKYHIHNGDVLFSWSADLNVYFWLSGKGLLNQHLFNVIPKDNLSKPFIFYALKNRMAEFRAKSLGTTMRHIKRSALDQVVTVVPARVFRDDFDKNILPIIDYVKNLKTRITNLRTTRDLLLPKLVSGKLDVSELDIQVPEEKSAA